MNKKFLAKVILATVLVGGVNLLPLSNLDVGNIQISVAYAESKNFAAKDGAMTDVEYIELQAKEASRQRAIEAVKEKIASYVRNFSGAKGKLTEDDIAAIAEKYEEVGTAKYKKLFYNAVDEDGRELEKVGIMYEATITAKFNSKKITEYIKLTEQEKARRIRQAREARAKFEELDREYEELRKNARTKTPEQLQAEIKSFDDKISDLEKSREKNKSTKTNKAVKKDNSTSQKNKSVSNVPMKFLKSVQIGEVTLPPMGYFDIKKADYHNGTPCTEKGYEHLGLYAKGIARFGNGEDALYFHYDANNGRFNGMVSRFGSQDFKNTVEDFPGIPGIVWNLKTNSGMKFYIIEHGDAAGFGSSCTLIGKNKDGKFVKYFNTKEIKDRYLGERNHRGISDEWNKFSFQDNTIVIRYGKYGSYNKFDAIGEFRFRWDETAQWFGVEQIIYSQKPTEQKPVQENKAVTNQPMKFSQPVKTGGAVWWLQGGGGINVQNATENNGDFYQHNIPNGRKIIYDGSNNGGVRYGKGVARFGNGDDALYAHYNGYNIRNDSFIHFGDKNIKNTIPISAFVFGEEIFKIPTNTVITFYMIHTSYDLPDENWWTLIGRRKDGVWVKYFDSDSVTVKYFGQSARGGSAGVWRGLSICCDNFKINGNTIIIEYSRNHENSSKRLNLVKEGEFRFKWDDKAQWFSVEQVKY